ncbi:TIGR00269 family protein [archaeon]|jgi:tRNA-5-methyluridine54 2-sulfurtransferase|nr:TIGR00269 family protein [archaeon]
MQCLKCQQKAVLKLQHGYLCKIHFIDYFEKKVFKTINKYKLISRTDVVCVATSGGKDSLTLLYTLKKYFERNQYDLNNLQALVIDEGIKGYRDTTIKILKKFCKKHKVPLNIKSFKEEFEKTLDQAYPIINKKTGKKPCTVCGIWRRFLLNKHAKELKATKLATGHNLDDEAQAIMMNTFKANVKQTTKLGPKTGIVEHEGFIQRIKPLYFCLEKETRLYTFLKDIEVDNTECPNVNQSYRAEVRDLLNQFEAKFSGTKTGIINSFLYSLDKLKECEIKEGIIEPKKCKLCKEPAQKEICNACELKLVLE